MKRDYYGHPEKIVILTEFLCILISILEILDDKACICCYKQMNKTTYTYCLVCRDVQIESNILDWQAMQKSFNELVMLLQREAGIVQDMINLNTMIHSAELNRLVVRSNQTSYQMCASISSDAINCWYGAHGLSFKKKNPLTQRCV
ncbi:uncharacterized protein CIMG_13649 [Coccidioides immitis RS]|uniref:Uncharacterized protein n=1 Tax=Coccidioides immitis (strain RS) TaxID=246410 RepID=A0A0D8JVT3_COCIM|nr:uncharacterized protein CIMG_13649 [Coccidioides immitis RS]KJF61417.1 hypothetical protein CIMG_13649 [Coccidioides immitis RS]